MSDGAPSTPAEVAAAREMMLGLRAELQILAAGGVPGAAGCLASARVAEASLGTQAGADAVVTITATEQPGSSDVFITVSRGGRIFVALGMSPTEAAHVASGITDILNNRAVL